MALSKFLGGTVTPNLTFFNWNRLKSIVKGWIYESISTSMFGYLSNGMTAHQQWVATYSTNVQSKVMNLHDWLYNMKKGNMHVSKYVLKAKISFCHMSSI